MKLKVRVAVLFAAAVALFLMTALPAQAMYCNIKNDPELSALCNQVISVVCGNPKLGPCE
ncbi:MAG TPA: hypothetical protein VFK89_01740 [Actinomycetota bacterium]|nr:hypothetical protein [Actinomycetota bacterium]